ncbi:MAG TPA: glycoside hydrolase family 2 TIM barrel-domain containing protein [Bryobacteraceae bacterium]|nr:glycoside hydrolase family 2 TIM barrel-domain containing protein [Bryobacteraceae bacterium]
MRITRRTLIGAAAGAAAASAQVKAAAPHRAAPTDVTPLDGRWMFHIGDGDFAAHAAGAQAWQEVTVPHTWNTQPETADYMGVAWYRRSFRAPAAWAAQTVRVEFEAVYHSARVFVNGKLAGEHLKKGYTAFTLDITKLVRPGADNTIAVRVDNAFADGMLPRGKSFDWTPDGGVYRPVSLLVTPAVFIENVAIDAVPEGPDGALEIAVTVRNTGAAPAAVSVGCEVLDAALSGPAAVSTTVPASETKQVRITATLPNARFWHFDHPNLYTLRVTAGRHAYDTRFGVRRFEVKDGSFVLNGEPVRLAGVERMAGSHPDYGMAEPAEWIEHDHRDMKELNCVFTRVHWAQDKRVLDYCDRHGILIQTEVPSWGPDTFKGMAKEPSAEIMQNGLEQLREMITRDRNHPSVFAWGLCNEVNGQNPAAQVFVRRMKQEARQLDPKRLLTYASNSLQTTPEKDVAGELDFISWNEYYESWYGGTAESVRGNVAAIQKAFPGKPIVVSEYGYCACTPQRPEDDAKRIGILRTHNAIYRESDAIGALIFFCYNDYRTHIGDKGAAVLKQRVHGVVDVYGARKTSFEALADESSPIESVTVVPEGNGVLARVRARQTVPSHRMRYTLRWIVYGEGEIPLEQREAPLTLAPGEEQTVKLEWAERAARRVQIEVRRPTGFVAAAFTYAAG